MLRNLIIGGYFPNNPDLKNVYAIKMILLYGQWD